MSSDPESELDRESMRRLAQGHDAALGDLMERHAGRLCAYLKRLLANPEDAEDLAQETFVRVYQNRGRYDPAHAFGAWLYAIAGNLVRDRFRWRTRHPEVPLEVEGYVGEDGVLRSPAPAVEARRGPDGIMEGREEAEAVRAAVRALPSELREPLVLAEFEGRSHAEIGVVLGCSAKAVEMKLYRARALLRKELGRWLGRDAEGKIS